MISSPSDAGGIHLTPRQHDVAKLYVDGLTVRAIGARLGISPRTVGNYLDVIHGKLGPTPSRTRRERITEWWHSQAA